MIAGRASNRALSRGVARRRLALMAALLAGSAVVCLVNPAFASSQNLRDLLVQATPAVIVASAMTFVILTGEIDISVGSLLGLLAAVMGILSSPERLGLSVPLVVAATLAAGAGLGLVNGLLVAVGRIPSIIATLGTFTILRGVTHVVMGGRWITDLPGALRGLGTGLPGLWTAATVVAISWVIAQRTPMGVRLRAVGDHAEAAAKARLSPAGVRLFAFTTSGLATAVAALVSVPQQSVIEPGIGRDFELVVITAVVVGGTSIRGGRGDVIASVLAALLLSCLRSALLFLNLGDTATYWERAIQGALILGAVLLDHIVPFRGGGRLSPGAAA